MTTSLRNQFDQRETLDTDTLPWVASPLPGVERRMLDREGGEVARATSIVRYAPGSRFDRHVHGGGEEILAGSYLRNPPGSAHAPFSVAGCLLLVKLWQFGPGDTETVAINTRQTPWCQGLVPGLSVMPLHEHNGISTALVRWAPHTRFNPHRHPGGEEIFVLGGVFHDEHGRYPRHSWLRSPRWSQHTPFTEGEGALIYVKVGHLGAPLLTPASPN